MVSSPARIVVIDTNVFLSTLITPKGETSRILQKICIENDFLFSHATQAELDSKVSSEKILQRRSWREIKLFTKVLRAEGRVVSTDPGIFRSRDTDDDKFLDLAVTGKADLIISGDPDLGQLKNQQGIGHIIPIIGVRDYAQQFPDGRGYRRVSRIPEILQAMASINKRKS